jgi:hypothetical protein
VLIAANVLKKNGKSVYCDEEIDLPSYFSKLSNHFLNRRRKKSNLQQVRKGQTDHQNRRKEENN